MTIGPLASARRLLHNGAMTRKIRNTGRMIDVSERLPALESILGDVPGLAAVYLYGSYGTPFQTPLSDVDLALVFVDGEEPSPRQHLELIGRITEALREDDVSVTILNRAPLAFRHRGFGRRSRRLFLRDEIAHADFLERTVSRYCDFAIDEARFFEEYDRALIEGVLSWRRLIARRCARTSTMCATTSDKLEQLRAEGREAFLGDDKSQAAAARWLQTAVEAVIDIANHVVAREGLGAPRAYSETI